MGLLALAVPAARRDPDAEDEVSRHVEEQHEQEPPGLDLKLEAGLVLDVDPDEVEADDESQQEYPRQALGDHEDDHAGHTTTATCA
jgi:hypothetical protein